MEYNISKLPIFDNVGVYPIITLGNKEEKFNCVEYEINKIDDLNNLDKHKKKENIFKRYKTVKEHNILINSGTTGFEAQKIIPLISSNGKGIKFVVSGTIDPYILLNQKVPYMKNVYTNPHIKYNEDIIAKSKFNFWNKNKIVIAGMTKRVEAVYVNTPLALGVGIYGMYDFAAYFISNDISVSNTAANIYNSLIRGDESYLGSSYIVSFDTERSKIVAKYLTNFNILSLI